MKKALLVLISLLCVFSMIACSLQAAAINIDLSDMSSISSNASYDFPSTDSNIKYGDVNKDKSVDNKDVLKIYKYIFNSKLYPIATEMLGDVNGDGKISNVDILKIYRYMYNSDLYTLDDVPGMDLLNNNSHGEAYYIFESYTDTSLEYQGQNPGLPNGWNYDNHFDRLNITGGESYKIYDDSDDEYYAFTRKFDAESDGLLRLELLAGFASSNGGAYITFTNSNGEPILTVTEQLGRFIIVGTNTATPDIGVAYPAGTYPERLFTIEIDLDNNKASVIIDNVVLAGEVDIAADAEISCLTLGTNKEGSGEISLIHAELNKNYALSDRFMIPSYQVELQPQPVGWDITGDFKLGYIPSEYYHNVYSVKAESSAGSLSTASKSFDPICGKISFETFILLPEKVDGASVALTHGGVEVLKFETKNGNIVMGDTILHENYSANVWQNLHIDADTDTGVATIYINGKKRAEINFTAAAFDGVNITFAPDKNAVMWFDDVVLHNLYDYADYPEYPQVAESKDYNVGVNVCWLWRDSNSGEGWDAASGFSELDTYLGSYDEGLRETADWELKYMAEHGIDFMNVCWYSPGHDVQVPIKKMYRSYAALHEGYMYAEYSDLVKFCLLWENSTQGFNNFEQFKNIFWEYWKEYYFSDERYMTLDGKAVITVWNKELLADMFGDEDEFKKAVAFMEQELIDMGYDGLILLFTTQGYETPETYTKYSNTYDGSYAYHYGADAYDPNVQITYNTTNGLNALSANAVHVPTISVGFNSLPRHETRNPLITAEDHLAVCEAAKDLLATYNTNSWKDNTVIISSWNEFTEGTYIFPTDGIGFSYLENIRKAFTNDTSDHSEIDAKPTQEQVDRVSHMYPDGYNTLSQLKDPVNVPLEDKILTEQYIKDHISSYTTTDSKNYAQSTWSDVHGNNVSISNLSSFSNRISGTSKSTNFGIALKRAISIQAADAPILHIQIKVDKPGTLSVFFTRNQDNIYDFTSENNLITYNLWNAGEEYVDCYIVMATHSNWNGTITNIRIDPGSFKGTTFEIKTVEFLKYNGTITDSVDNYNVTINDTTYTPPFCPEKVNGTEYELVTNRSFFIYMNLYYEWDRNDGILTIKTKAGDTFVLKSGEDFEIYDGLPKFNIKELCNKLGYSCNISGNTIAISQP